MAVKELIPWVHYFLALLQACPGALLLLSAAWSTISTPCQSIQVWVVWYCQCGAEADAERGGGDWYEEERQTEGQINTQLVYELIIVKRNKNNVRRMFVTITVTVHYIKCGILYLVLYFFLQFSFLLVLLLFSFLSSFLLLLSLFFPPSLLISSLPHSSISFPSSSNSCSFSSLLHFFLVSPPPPPSSSSFHLFPPLPLRYLPLSSSPFSFSYLFLLYLCLRALQYLYISSLST